MSGTKRPLDGGAAAAELPHVEVIPLGAGQEVGRSCIIVKYMGKTVMLDAGIHPGFTGPASLPYFDEIDMDEVDVMLITHFHLDHIAAAPYVAAKTTFKGRILMTHPTKAIMNTLLRDFVKVSRGSVDEGLYNEKDLDHTLERTELIDFQQTVDLDGIRVTAYRAGHVLGAAMFMVEIAGMRLLYTGDYSRLPDRHLSAADLPDVQPHILVVESTYGVNRHEERVTREARLCSTVRGIVSRGGKVLMPVVALGRAQELLLILEEYWSRHPELHHVPIQVASQLTAKTMPLFQTYIAMMNDEIQTAFRAANPFKFKHVEYPSRIEENGLPQVVLATPSMLQSGVSRQLFDRWADNSKNGVIIADFAVAGTMARQVLDSPAEVMTHSGVKVPLRMSVDAISFSAHADFPQTSEFVEALQPPHVVLVHGEPTNMQRLRDALLSQAKALGQTRHIYMPRVTQAVHIEHKPERLAKVMGQLAEKPPIEGRPISGLLVRGRRHDAIVAPADLPAYTRLRPGRILQRQALPLTRPFSEVRLALELVFEGLQVAGLPTGGGGVGVTSGASAQSLKVGDAVTVTLVPAVGKAKEHVVVEWEGGALPDLLADAVTAILLQNMEEPQAVSSAEKRRRLAVAENDVAAVAQAEMDIIAALLTAQFGPAHVDVDQELILLQVDGVDVAVDYQASKVECNDAGLRARIDRAVSRLTVAMRPVNVDHED